MYTVKAPILGFEEYKQVDIDLFDQFFSTIIFNEEDMICMNIANAKHLHNINFNLDSKVLKKLDLEDTTQFDIYFTMVIQTPSEESIINLGAPIIVNEDKKYIGQFIAEDNDLFTMHTIKDLSTL